LTLLKNDNARLPLAPTSTVLVAGAGADSVPMLVGGWSMNWQGSGLQNSDFPTGASAYAAISEALAAGGGKAILSADGAYASKPDAAIVVFGETPYAEYQGDRESVLYAAPGADRDLQTMKKLQSAGIPVIGVFISGRPLWINEHLNASDAMIAAFLPGTEGGRAIADLVIQNRAAVAHDFTGKLSFSWPKSADQFSLNAGAKGYDPLFALGYGLTLKDRKPLPTLTTQTGLSDTLLAAASSSVFFEDGRALAPWRVYLGDSAEARLKTEGERFVESPSGAIRYESADRNRQEDTKRVTWKGAEKASLFVLGYSSVDFQRQRTSDEAVVVSLAVLGPPSAKTEIAFGARNRHARVDVTSTLKGLDGGTWSTISIPLRCLDQNVDFSAVEMPFLLETSGSLDLQIADLRLGPAKGVVIDCGA
jgi:beta-glucosidase